MMSDQFLFPARNLDRNRKKRKIVQLGYYFEDHMSEIAVRYDRIKTWLNEYGKFIVNEREKDEHYHFSFWIWDKQGKKGLIPLLIGHMKEPQKQMDCIQIGWGWNLDKSSNVVKDVINDPDKTAQLVESLKKVINPKKYLLSFVPNEQTLDSIKVSFVYPIDWLDKQSLFNEIIQTWVQYGNLVLHLELKSGRPTSIDKFRRPY